jgi:hypothetical protein
VAIASPRGDGVLIDHLVVGVPALAEGGRRPGDLLGIEPVAGGRHPGRGTANALLRLGEESYFEVLDPVPEPGTRPAAWLASSRVGRGKLIGWALRPLDIEADARILHHSGGIRGSLPRLRARRRTETWSGG